MAGLASIMQDYMTVHKTEAPGGAGQYGVLSTQYIPARYLVHGTVDLVLHRCVFGRGSHNRAC
jgi:hypothetical protein